LEFVFVGCVATALDDVATFVQGRGLAEVVAVVQVVHVAGNHLAHGVEPGAVADAVAYVDRRYGGRGGGGECRRHAQTSTPSLGARTGSSGQFPAQPVGARQTAQVGIFAAARAADEIAHGTGGG